MALIKCKECGKKISNTSKKCPNCGYKIKKGSSNIVLSFIVGIIIIILLIVLIISKGSLSKEEKAIFDSIVENKNDFKDPSSVKLLSATYCSEKSLILTINAKNSYGGYVQDTYYVYNGNLLEEMDFDDILETYQDDKEELRRQYYIYQAYEKSVEQIEKDCDSDKIVNLSENAIKKINKKLGH